MDRPVTRRLGALFSFCSITVFALGLILFSKDVSSACARALSLCLQVVIPSLFPFFVLSQLAVTSGMSRWLARLAARPMALFGLPGSCAPAVVMGAVGGYPVGARTAFALYDAGACTAGQCARLLSFCSCCGPAFLVSAVGVGVFGSLRTGLLLWGAHLLAASLVGLVGSVFARRERGGATLREGTKRVAVAPAVTSAVTESCGAMLNVCGFVVFFAALTSLLRASGALAFAARLLPLPEAMAEGLLCGALEMTGGIASLPGLGLTAPQALALSALIAGWGGASVHCQVISLRGERPVPLQYYCRGKLMHGLLAAALTYAWALRLPGETAVMGGVWYGNLYLANPGWFIVFTGLYLTVALLLSWLLTRFDKKRL